MLGARTISVARPRGRLVDGGEVELDTWETFASEDLLRQVVVERMLAGVATRRHVDVAEPVGDLTGTATSKSAVSRRFVAATSAAMAELLAADLSGLEVALVMIDGLNVASEMIVVALVICTDGTKVPVGLRLGDTENAVVVKDLLADLVDRGLRFEHGILAVLDGSKALRKAVAKVFGAHALVQRCTLHKRRNVTDYLPKARRTRSTSGSLRSSRTRMPIPGSPTRNGSPTSSKLIISIPTSSVLPSPTASAMSRRGCKASNALPPAGAGTPNRRAAAAGRRSTASRSWAPASSAATLRG